MPAMGLPEVLSEIRAAEAAAARQSGSVRLVAVSKGHSAEEIQQKILTHGAYPLGENRGQELRDKGPQLPGAEWHYIGPVQRNKIKYLKDVTLIHTLEDRGQAEALAQQAEKWGRAPATLIQVHNGEAQKHGAAPAEVPELLAGARRLGLEVRGLMVMAPYDDQAAAERVFAATQALATALGLRELSMGMSDDFQIAVRYGATLVRVGRRLFT